MQEQDRQRSGLEEQQQLVSKSARDKMYDGVVEALSDSNGARGVQRASMLIIAELLRGNVSVTVAKEARGLLEVSLTAAAAEAAQQAKNEERPMTIAATIAAAQHKAKNIIAAQTRQVIELVPVANTDGRTSYRAGDDNV